MAGEGPEIDQERSKLPEPGSGPCFDFAIAFAFAFALALALALALSLALALALAWPSKTRHRAKFVSEVEKKSIVPGGARSACGMKRFVFHVISQNCNTS